MAADNSAPQMDNSPDPGTMGPPAPSSPKVSPYLVMAAQKEVAAGKPGPNVHALGMAGLAAKHPAAIAGAMAAQGGASPQSAPTAANPAGSVGSTSGEGSQGNAPAPGQVGPPRPSVANGGMPAPAPQTPGSADPDDQKIAYLNQLADKLGVKNKFASTSTEQSDKSSGTSSMKTGSFPGTYSRGEGEYEGYSYTPIYKKDAQGNDTQEIAGYTKSDKPDPNSAFQKQQSAIDQLSAIAKQRAAMGRPIRPTDLTGFMMMADALGGTDKYVKDYASQRNADEQNLQSDRKDDQQNFQDEAEALKQQGDLYKNAGQVGLGIMGGGQVGSANQIATVAKQLESAGSPRGPAGNGGKMTDAQFDQSSSKMVADAQKKDGAMNDLARMLALGNPTADNMSAIAGAKAMAGTSRINVQEIQSFKNPDSSLWGRVDQILGRAGNGQYTPEDRAQLMQLYQQLSQARQAEGQANMAIIHNRNETMRMNPQDPAIIDQVYGAAMHPNIGNTNFNLAKAGKPHHVTPVTPGQNYDGSTPLSSNATPAMKQARAAYLKQKAGQ